MTKVDDMIKVIVENFLRANNTTINKYSITDNNDIIRKGFDYILKMDKNPLSVYVKLDMYKAYTI